MVGCHNSTITKKVAINFYISVDSELAAKLVLSMLGLLCKA
jgi:hypothetical protein